jgi:hypothetical protein
MDGSRNERCKSRHVKAVTDTAIRKRSYEKRKCGAPPKSPPRKPRKQNAYMPENGFYN